MCVTGLTASIRNWKVSDATILSDRNYIEFILQTSTMCPQIRVNKLKLDYQKLDEFLGAGDLINASTLDAERCAITLALKITEVCGTETAAITSKRKSINWWTPELINS